MRIALTLASAVLALAAAPAHAAVRVVTATEGLAAIAKEVAGNRASVESLSRGVQDPHFVDPNPMLAVKLRSADLLVDVGLDLEIGWLPPLVNQSRNGAIQPNGSRRLTAASAVAVLDVPSGPVDRSMGDLHPAGNPHFMTDPRRVAQVAQAIAAKLQQLDPGGASEYASRLDAFQKRLQADQTRWLAQLAPFKGAKVFTKHRTLTYFFDWSGLVDDGELEPKPGIPPSPAHLADLVGVAKRDHVRAVIVEDYYDTQSADVVRRFAGVKIVQIPGDVGAEPGVGGYEKFMDTVVNRIVGGLR